MSCLCQPLWRKKCQTADVLLFLQIISLIEMPSYPWIFFILLLYSNRHLNSHLDTCPPVIKTTCPISPVAGVRINLLFSFLTFLLVKYRCEKIYPVDFWQERKKQYSERKESLLNKWYWDNWHHFQKKKSLNIKPTCYTKFHLKWIIGIKVKQ